MKSYLLDKKDRKILSVICNNARLSYNQIGKKTKISKDRVRARILNMEKHSYIKFYYPLINYKKIGLPVFHIYCKLDSIKSVNKKNLSSLIKNKFVIAVTWLMGNYDLEIQIMAKDRKKVKTILKNQEIYDHISEYKITFPQKPEIYSTNFTDANFLDKIKENEIESLDEKDKKLISLLGKNARARIIDLAYELDVDESDVRYRLKNLIKKEIIWGFHAATYRTFTGLIRYLVLIKVKNKLNQKEIESLRQIKNIFYLKRCEKEFDYILRFQATNDSSLTEIFHKLKSVFSRNLIDFKVHTILRVEKFDPTPCFD